jgi:hypothetical protein
MKFSVMQLSGMAGAKGDIFWDMASWISYVAGYDLGCTIFVANTTDHAQEYALMAELRAGAAVISEEALPVFGLTKFTVEPGDFVELDGALRFSDSNAVLTVKLVDPATSEVIDAVSAMLIDPSSSTSALPPAWPGTQATTGATTDWGSMMGFIMPVLMFGMLGMMMVSAFKPRDEKTQQLRRSE